MHPFTDTKTHILTRPRSRLETVTLAASACLGVFALLGIYYTWARSGFPPVKKAVAVLTGPSNVTGTVRFFQPDPRGPVTVEGNLKGLDANALRGFHVHQTGDLTNGCLSAGAHHNPFNTNHGGPNDRVRHAGDLGNIRSDGNGEAIFTITDFHLSLNGPRSILGRSVVVHAGTDDLGKGGNPESLKTGNAGARSACGVIGLGALD